MRSLELKIPPVAVFLISAAVMWLLSRNASALDFVLPYAAGIATLTAVPGLIAAVLGVRAFRRESTTVDPRKPAEASSIVNDGVYRFTRNPMYLGLACCILAWGLYLQNIAALVFTPVFILYMTRFQIEPEEQVLQEKFGADYANYRSRVRRWL